MALLCPAAMEEKTQRHKNLSRAKTFWTERVNCFHDKYIKKVGQLFWQHLHKYVFERIYHPESFQTIRKVSRSSRKFSDHLESTKHFRIISRSSGKFPNHPESFQIIQKVSRSSGMCKTFPGGNAATRHGFFCLCISCYILVQHFNNLVLDI